MKVLLQWCLALLCLFGMSDVKSQDLNFNQPAVAKPEIVLPIGHLGYMESAVFSPDGKFIVTSNDDGTAKVYDVATGKELRTYIGHTENVNNAIFSPDGKYVLTVSDDSTAILHDALTGKSEFRFANINNDIDDVKFIMNGKFIAITTEENSILYETQSRKDIIRTKQAIFSENGKYIELEKSKSKYFISSIRKDQKRIALNDCVNIENGSTFNNNGSMFFANADDSIFSVYDTDNGNKLLSWSTNKKRVSFACFSPLNKFLMIATVDSVFSVYNLQNGKIVFKKKGVSTVDKAIFNQDDSKFIILYNNYIYFNEPLVHHPIQIYDVEKENVIAEIPVTENIISMNLNSDGTKIITTDYDENVIWEFATGKRLATLNPNSLYINNVVFSPDNKNLAIACPHGKVWDIKKGRPVIELTDGNCRTFDLKYNKTGDKIFSYNSDTVSRIWNVADGSILKKIKTIDRTSVFSESSDRFVNYDFFQNVFHLYDIKDGKFLYDLNSGECGTINDFGYVKVCRLTKDGSRFIITNEKNINIWDVNLGLLIYDLRGHKGTILSSNLSSDENKLVTASSDNTAKVWNMNNGNLLFTLLGHKDEVNDAVFSHDSKRIATASTDGTVKLWNSQNGRLITTLLDSFGEVTNVLFNEDDSRLLSSHKGAAVLWDLKTNKQIATLTGHYDNTICSFSSDNKLVVTYGRKDHVIHFWNNNGNKLYSLLFTGEKDYLVFDEQNHYDGSKGALEQVYYTQGNKIISSLELSNKDYVPGLVEKIMSNY